MNAQIAVYDAATGRILRTVSGAVGHLGSNVHAGEAALLTARVPHSDLEYVVTGPHPALAARPASALVLPEAAEVGAEVHVNAPPGAAIIIDGVAVGEADAEGVVFSFAGEGQYVVEVEAWPHQAARSVVVVT